MPSSTRYVVLEWNQASGTPKIAVDDLFDDPTEAGDMAADLTKEARSNDRGERYTIHEVDMDGADA